jgi:site-specific DNA-cytosine methylase
MGDGFLLRTFPDYFPQTADAISPSFSRRWPTSGFSTARGACWTADTSESPSDGDASSFLPDVLQEDAPQRFYLSPKAAAGIIRRAKKRGRKLPKELAPALTELARRNHLAPGSEVQGQTCPTPKLDGLPPVQPSVVSGEREPADPPATNVRTSSLPVAVSENQRAEVRETSYARQLTTGGGKPGQGYPMMRDGKKVRRLTPTECERLQGFPDGWTIP